MTGLIASLLLSLWCAEFTTSQLISCNEPDRVQLSTASGYFTEERAGRVEICDCNILSPGCQWKTITVPIGSVAWGWKNAQVACREIYPEDYGVVNPILQDTLPDTVRADSSQSVFSYVINCDGTEASLANCSMTPSLVTSHARDAYIRCRSSIPYFRDVRLTGSMVSNAVGAVEVYDSSLPEWRTVCAHTWRPSDADVACMQLGYESGTPTSFDSRNFTGPKYAAMNVNGFFCDGNEASLYHCPFSSYDDCIEPNILGGVTCTASGLPEGSVRLNPPSYINLDRSDTHRVEVLYNGRWGSICNSGWDFNDGEVVCQSLGEGAPYIDTHPVFSFAPAGPVPIWLSSLHCEGSEDNLTLCDRDYPVGYAPSCTRYDNAGLECAEKGLSAGKVVAIAFAVVVALIIIVPFTFLFCKKIVKVTKRSKSTSSTNRADDLPEQDHELAEQGHTSPPEPSQDKDLRKEASPSCFDTAPLVTASPIATPDPLQCTIQEQLGDPESSPPSCSKTISHLSHPLPTSMELSPPQTSNTEASPSHPQASSDAVEVHANSEVIPTHPMPADISLPTSTFQQVLGDDKPPPYPPEVSSHAD